MMKPEIGLNVRTPRFGKVRISAIFENRFDFLQIYAEPTDYDGDFKVYGRRRGNKWDFAALVPPPDEASR
jgi:hypothetical protein